MDEEENISNDFYIDEEEQKIKEERGYSQHFGIDVKLFGERTTLTQVVILLAFLRDLIQKKEQGEIKISVGKHLETDVFSFTVNDQEVPHVKAQKEMEIN